jgi:AcrR family transcriptional regulator
LTRAVDVAAGTGAGGASGRMAGEERRQQILLVAMRLFSQRGFRGTTTKEIANGAGVSEAMVFRHFATKEELYRAILDHKACAGGIDPCLLLGAAIARKDDRAVFETLALAMMRHHEQDTEFMRLLSHAALEEHQLVELFFDRNVRQMYELLGGYIRERQRDGAFRPVEPAVAVRAFLGMIIHHSLNNTLWDKRRSLLDIPNERAAQEFTNIILGGITVAPNGKPKRRVTTNATARKQKGSK